MPGQSLLHTGRRNGRRPYLYLAPAFLLLAAVILIPLLYALYLSFFKTQGVNREFVGLANYIDILKQSYFWASTGRTLYFTVVSVAVEFVIGLGVALLLSQNFKLRGFLRVMLILPWALPTVVNGVLWSWIFNTSYGSLNGLLLEAGVIDNYVSWLGKPFLAMNCVIFADVWKNYAMIAFILMAGLQTISPTYYESAMIDGANVFQRFRYITLPILRPAILVCLITRTMEAFKVFDIVYTMTKGGPANGTQVISYYTYQITFQYSKFGYGAALSYLISFVILMMALAYIRVLRGKEE